MYKHVLRIEHKDSRLGPYFHPYQDDAELAFMVSLDREGARWPSPQDDGINEQLIRFTDGWRFGWESLTSLQAWFDASHIQNLHNLGFRVTTWQAEVGHHMRGEHQVAFRLHRATILDIVSLVDLERVRSWDWF